MIVTTLDLDGMAAADLDPDRPLFGEEGLGLDSIDAMELGVALKRRYHVSVGADTKDIDKHFATVRSMAAFISISRKD